MNIRPEQGVLTPEQDAQVGHAVEENRKLNMLASQAGHLAQEQTATSPAAPDLIRTFDGAGKAIKA